MAIDILYLIHLDQPLSHAQHYLGSSTDVVKRLTQHANGHGARITEVLHEQKKDWTLAAAFAKINPHHDIRQLERNAKKRHNAARYCPICDKQNIAPKGTRQLPDLRLTSQNLRTDNE